MKFQLKFVSPLFLIVLSFILSGCLTAEKKEYSFTVNPDGSGKGKIKFINIFSQADDQKDVSFSDFEELMQQYVKGDKFETENSNYKNVTKTLIEENGVLVGEVSFTFDNLADVKFLYEKKCDCCPVYYFLGAMSETYDKSNGEKVSEDVPLIKWAGKTKEFTFNTLVNQPDSTSHSLLPVYKTWKEVQK